MHSNFHICAKFYFNFKIELKIAKVSKFSDTLLLPCIAFIFWKELEQISRIKSLIILVQQMKSQPVHNSDFWPKVKEMSAASELYITAASIPTDFKTLTNLLKCCVITICVQRMCCADVLCWIYLCFLVLQTAHLCSEYVLCFVAICKYVLCFVTMFLFSCVTTNTFVLCACVVLRCIFLFLCYNEHNYLYVYV